MLYGAIADFLPSSPARFSVIAANPGLPCGPFTLMHRSSLAHLPDAGVVREAMEDPVPHAVDESRALLEVLGGNGRAHCETAPLQPARAEGFNYWAARAIWRERGIVVSDNRGRSTAGAFYHFKRYKRLPSFRVQEDAAAADAWLLDRFGIRALDSAATA